MSGVLATTFGTASRVGFVITSGADTLGSDQRRGWISYAPTLGSSSPSVPVFNGVNTIAAYEYKNFSFDPLNHYLAIDFDSAISIPSGRTPRVFIDGVSRLFTQVGGSLFFTLGTYPGNPSGLSSASWVLPSSGTVGIVLDFA